MLRNYKISREDLLVELQNNKHNKATTLYYLLLRKIEKEKKRRNSLYSINFSRFNKTMAISEEPPNTAAKFEIRDSWNRKIETPDDILKKITARVTIAIHRGENSVNGDDSFSFDKSSFYAEKIGQHNKEKPAPVIVERLNSCSTKCTSKSPSINLRPHFDSPKDNEKNSNIEKIHITAKEKCKSIITDKSIIEKKDFGNTHKSIIENKKVNAHACTTRNGKKDLIVNTKGPKPIKINAAKNVRTAYQKYMKTIDKDNDDMYKSLCVESVTNENSQIKTDILEVESLANKTFIRKNNQCTSSRAQQYKKTIPNCNIIRRQLKTVLGMQDENSISMSAHTTFIKSPKKNDFSQKPKIYRGAFDLTCISAKPASDLMNEICKVLDTQNIKYKKCGGYLVVMQKQGVKLELEIMQMEDMEFMHIIRLKRIEGNVINYKTICKKLIASMKL